MVHPEAQPMKFHTTIALIVAALTLSAGAAAAMPGNASTDAASAGNGAADAEESAAQDAETSESDANKAEANETDGENAANASEARGPPADMPAQVPDHVSQIHDLIGQFLAGDLTGSLGEAVSDVAGNDSEATNNSQSPNNASANAAA